MAAENVVEKVKAALRIRTTAFDEAEIAPLIDACAVDMQMAGVSVIDESDASYIRAATLYCKAYFGYLDDSEKWRACYESLRDSMALSGEYGEVQNPIEED